MTGDDLSLNLLVNSAIGSLLTNKEQHATNKERHVTNKERHVTNKERHVTTSLQPHNLQNWLRALCTSAMLQRYNLYSKKLYTEKLHG